MIFLLNIAIIAALAVGGYKLSARSELKGFYWPGLGLKLVAGITVGLLYLYYYDNGDSWVMFNEAVKVKNAAFTSVDGFIRIYFRSDYSEIAEYAYNLQPRAAFMTKILAYFVLITKENYWLSGCYLSLFSFSGFWALANLSYKILQDRWATAIPTLFFPSIVFWTSGMLKEAVAIGALAWVLALLLSVLVLKRFNWRLAILLIICLLLVAYLKYYYAAVLVVTSITFMIAQFILPKKSAWYVEFIVMAFLFGFILSLASLTHINFWPSRFLEVIVDNYYQFLDNSSMSNVVIFRDLAPTIPSLLIHSPKALFAGLFFPLWMSSPNLLKIISVMENWVLLLAAIYAGRQFTLPAKQVHRLLLWAMILFVVTTAVFITFSSPNLGTLVRYRVGYLVVFLLLVTGAINPKRLV
jgi:hypothetical protein